jgi:hypothetical protein
VSWNAEQRRESLGLPWPAPTSVLSPTMSSLLKRESEAHDLRHTGISDWLAAGLSVFEVSRYAGTSLTMISSVYGHLTFGALDIAANRLDAHAASVLPTCCPLTETAE